MCESSAYLLTADGEEKIMDYCIEIIPQEDGKILLADLLGEEKLVDAIIKEVKLLDHKIILQARS